MDGDLRLTTVEDLVALVSGRCLVHDITVDRMLTLQGGWNRDLTVRDTVAYTTTLDAQWMGRVLAITGDISPTIDGFLIGGQVGGDIQFNNFVLGVVGDMNWSDMSGSGGTVLAPA